MPSYLSPGVYVEEVASGSRPIEGVGTSVAAFVGLAPVGPLNEPTLVTNWTQYVASFGEFTDGYFLAHSVYGFFNNGGSAAYVVRVGGVPGGGRRRRPRRARPVGHAPARARRSGEPAQLGTFTVAAVAPGRSGAISVEVADPEGDGPADRFKLIVKDGEKAVESFEVRRRRAAATTSSPRSRSAPSSSPSGGRAGRAARPARQPDGRRSWPRPPGRCSVPDEAAGRRRCASAEYLGDSADRTGFGGLEAVDEISMVAVPDLMAAYQRGAIDLEAVKAVQLGLIAHCEPMGDRVAVIDPPPGLNARAGPRVAAGDRGLRLQVRGAVLPVDQGL